MTPISKALFVVLLLSSGQLLAAETSQWATGKCTFIERKGIYPTAVAALESIGMAHRLNNGLNYGTESRNVHGPDNAPAKPAYTGAVDVSIKCINPDSEATIKLMLSALADAGFAAWYRKDQVDGWVGSNHIHAVYVSEPLKPVLRKQVKAWLDGLRGLACGAKRSEVWQASADQKAAIKEAFEKANPPAAEL